MKEIERGQQIMCVKLFSLKTLVYVLFFPPLDWTSGAAESEQKESSSLVYGTYSSLSIDPHMACFY